MVGGYYLISRKWALNSRFAITDETGTPVQGRFSLTRKLSVSDTTGTAVEVNDGEDAVLMLVVPARHRDHQGRPAARAASG